MADMRGLVAVDGRVLDDELDASAGLALAKRIALRQRARHDPLPDTGLIECDIEEAGSHDAHVADDRAAQGAHLRSDPLGDPHRWSPQLACVVGRTSNGSAATSAVSPSSRINAAAAS